MLKVSRTPRSAPAKVSKSQCQRNKESPPRDGSQADAEKVETGVVQIDNDFRQELDFGVACEDKDVAIVWGLARGLGSRRSYTVCANAAWLDSPPEGRMHVLGRLTCSAMGYAGESPITNPDSLYYSDGAARYAQRGPAGLAVFHTPMDRSVLSAPRWRRVWATCL